ncbi:MAG: isoleucine--tRNA ligase [Alphaproteobacteria bacterium]|nr:isoleucine--tRNA ligase [Alphaproteobacteria bacterium]
MSNDSSTQAAPGRDWKSTVFLPKTEFAMKAGLPKREPELLAYWRKIGLWRKLRAQSKGREKFILHDGPPYANGHLHIGHALNKIMKDLVTRTQQMLGKDSNYVPGWDCHGLPIEWKIEEEYRAKGKDKDAVPIVEFRRQCREFAEHWMKVQSEEFQRLGCVGEWDDPYATMHFESEALIAAEIHKFLMNGGLFLGNKPVLWSVVEKTALAEAEVEYEDFTSDTVWVKFPVALTVREGANLSSGPLVNWNTMAKDGASILIWTTTPWTLPGNRAISYSPRIEYGLYEVQEAPTENWAKAGDKYILACKLADEVFKQARVARYQRLRAVAVEEFVGANCTHPLASKDPRYGFKVPLLAGHHVTDDAGTGFVHTAPGHGREDYDAWMDAQGELAKRGIDTAIPYTVDADGRFTEQAPGFTGKQVITDKGEKGDANEAVIKALADAGMLIARGRMKHQYPHSWRSKKPLIFRNTPQWFIGMERNDLRKKALKAIDDTRFVPASGRNRLYAMIEQRPDWCVSRQRAWGVPIAVFVDRKSGEPLKDPEVNQRIVEAFKKDGADAWFAPGAPQKFLGNKYDAADYDQVQDIIEVWFESGSTHAFCLEQRPELKWPADLYLEGSDQHRGWFHSSLLESCGTRGRAPYDAVLTHGFVLDEQGRKMSKSLGNVVAPQDVTAQHGADILRLWVVASNYAEDLNIGPEIIKSTVDSYRRLRNTLRYLLGALAGFSEAERVAEKEMPELERFVLHRLAELDQVVRKGADDFDFHEIYVQLHQFCAVDLSAFYFDIRKDSLYCDRPDDKRRRACRTVMDQVFQCLTAWLAPILCFTAEEAWLARRAEQGGKGEESVHLRLYPAVPAQWRDDALAQRWEKLRAARRVVTGALERERAAKRIGSSLQAAPVLYAEDAWQRALAGADMDEICITSGLAVAALTDAPKDGLFTLPDVPGIAVAFQPAQGHKCERCWRVLPEVGKAPARPGLCLRCTGAVGDLGQAAE